MPKSRYPNILWIGADEQQRSTIGAYGSNFCRTPCLDRLAEQSLVFDNALTPTAVCAPARASLLTGRLPSEGSVNSNDRMDWTVPYLQIAGPRIMPTWAPVLRQAGYRLVYAGKWHVVPDDTPPSAYGFEGPDWPGYGGSDHNRDFHAYRRKLNLPGKSQLEDVVTPKHVVPPWFNPISGKVAGDEKGGLTAFLGQTALNYLDELAEERKTTGRPFMLRCEFWGPHISCFVPEPYFSMYDPDKIPLPDNFGKLGENKPEVQRNFWGSWGISNQTQAVQRRVIAAYLGYVTYIDTQVGRLIEAMERHGLADDTIVIYTTDHGDMLGSHGLYDKGPFMYEEIYRVPLMVRWPGVVGPGRSDALVYNMDLAPTMWEIVGESQPQGGSSRSLLPLLQGRQKDLGRDYLICEFHRQHEFYPQAMVHSGFDKYIYNFGGTDEYYDLRTDPGEMINRFRDPSCKQRICRLRAELHAWMLKVRSPMREGFERTLQAKLLG